MQLVFANCREYNAADSQISALANRIEQILNRLITDWVVGQPGMSKDNLPQLEMLDDDACQVRRPTQLACLPAKCTCALVCSSELAADSVLTSVTGLLGAGV